MAPRIPAEGGSGPQSQRGVGGASVPPPSTTVGGAVVPGRITVQDGSNSTSSPVFTGTAAFAGGDGTYGSPRPTASYENEMAAAWDVPDEVNKYLNAADRDWITKLAKAQGGRSGSALWQRALDASQAAAAAGRNVSPYTVLQEMAAEVGFNGAGGPKDRTTGGGGGSSGGGGPSASMSFQQIGEADLQDLANQIGMEMVGRGVSDDEFAKILKRVRSVEAKRPQITSSNGAGSSTTLQGVSNSDRQDVIQNILAKNPQYGDYQKATTMMDWFGNALNARLQNA